MGAKLNTDQELPSQSTISFPDCHYMLQKAPFLPLPGKDSPNCKIVELPYHYADNSAAVIAWGISLEDLKAKKLIKSFKFIPSDRPTSILVEYPSSSSCSTSIG